MALTEVLRALEEEASARFDRIRRRAEEEAQSLLAAAEQKRRPLLEDAMSDARATLAAERARRLARARFAVCKEVTLAKEALIDEVFRRAAARIAQVRGTCAYPEVFLALVREALAGFAGRVTLSVDPQDEALAQAALEDLGCAAEVRGDLQTAGGVRVVLDGGRVVIDNTLEARLAKAERFLRAEVSRCLFGK